MPVNVGDLEFVLGVKHDGITTANKKLANLRKNLKGAATEMEKLRKASSSFEKIGASAVKTADKQVAANKRVRKSTEQVNKTEKQRRQIQLNSAKMTGQLAMRQAAQLERQKKAVTGVRNQYLSLRQQLEDIGGSRATRQISILDRQFQRYQKTMRSGALSTERFNERQARMGNVMRLVRRDAKEHSKSITSLQASMRELTSASVLAVGPLSQVGARVQALGSIMGRTNIAIAAAIGSFVLLTAGSAALGVQIIQAATEMEKFVAVLFTVTNSMQRANQELERIAEFSDSIGVAFRTLVGEYAKIRAAADATNMSLIQTNRIFEGFATAAAALRLNAEQTRGTFKALEQMISKGNVQAEELRGQLGERLPGAFGLAAKSMNVTTTELNEMLERGEVLATDLLPRMSRLLKITFAESAARNVESINGATNRLSTAFFRLMTAIDDATGLSKAYVAVLQGLRNAMEFLRVNIDTIVQTMETLILTLAGGLAGRALPAAIRGVKSLTAAVGGLVAAMSTRGIAMFASALGGATGGVGALLTLIGGGIGLLLSFDEKQRKASHAVEMNNKAIQKLNETIKENLDITSKQVAKQQESINLRIQSTRAELRGLQAQLQTAREELQKELENNAAAAGRGRGSAKIQKLREEIEKYQIKIKELEESLGELEQADEKVIKGRQRLAAEAMETSKAVAQESYEQERLFGVTPDVTQAIRDMGDAAAALQIAVSDSAVATRRQARANSEFLNSAIKYAQSTATQKDALGLIRNEMGAYERDAFEAAQRTDDLIEAAEGLVDLDLKMDQAMAKVPDDVLDSYKQQRDALKESIALIGKEGEAARLTYATEHGALRELDEPRKEKLIKLGKELDLQQKIYEATTGAKDMLKNLKKQNALMGDVTEKERMLYLLNQDRFDLVPKELRKQLIREAELSDEKERQIELEKELQKVQQGAEDYAENLERQIDLLGRETEYEKALYEVQQGRWREADQATKDQITARAKVLTQLKKLREQESKMVKIFENAAEGIQKAFTNFFQSIFDDGISGFKDFADKIKDVFTTMLAELATLAIAKPIIVPVMRGMGGAMGLNQQTMNGILGQFGGSAGGGGGGFMNSLAGQAGQSVMSNYMPGAGNFTGGATFWEGLTTNKAWTPFPTAGELSGAFPGVFGGGAQPNAAALAGKGGYMNSVTGATPNAGAQFVSKALPVAGAITGGYGMYQSYKAGDPVGGAMSGAATGASIGSMVPVIGTAIGAVVGAIAGALGGALGGPNIDDWDVMSGLNLKGQEGLSREFTNLGKEGRSPFSMEDGLMLDIRPGTGASGQDPDVIQMEKNLNSAVRSKLQTFERYMGETFSEALGGKAATFSKNDFEKYLQDDDKNIEDLITIITGGLVGSASDSISGALGEALSGMEDPKRIGERVNGLIGALSGLDQAIAGGIGKDMAEATDALDYMFEQASRTTVDPEKINVLRERVGTIAKELPEDMGNMLTVFAENFEGTAEQFQQDMGKAAASLKTIHDFSDVGVEGRTENTLSNQENTTLWEQFNKQATELEKLTKNFDGSLESTQDLAQGVIEFTNAEQQMLAALRNMREGIINTANSMKDQFKLDTLDEEGSFGFIRGKGTKNIRQLQNAEDPEDIVRFGNRALSNANTAWGFLSDEQKQKALPDFLGFTEGVKDYVTDQLDQLGIDVKDTSFNLESDVEDKTGNVADTMLEAANKEKSTAEKNAKTATKNKQTAKDLRAAVDKFAANTDLSVNVNVDNENDSEVGPGRGR